MWDINDHAVCLMGHWTCAVGVKSGQLKPVPAAAPIKGHVYIVYDVRKIHGVCALKFADFPNMWWNADYFRKVDFNKGMTILERLLDAELV